MSLFMKLELVGVTLVACAASAGILDEKPSVWYRADRGIETNTEGGIVRWRNEGALGEALDLLPVNPGPRVKVQGQGGKPAIAFSGSGWLRSVTTNDFGRFGGGGTWFAVYTPTTELARRGNMGVFGAMCDTARLGVFYPVDPGGSLARTFFGSLASTDVPATLAPKILAVCCRKDGAVCQTETWLDGVAVGAQTVAPSTSWAGVLTIGRMGEDHWMKPFVGEFSELRLYDRALSVNERSAVEAELSTRYGVPIGTNAVQRTLIRGVPAEQPQATILWTKVLCKEPGRYIGWPTITRRRNGELLGVFSGDRGAHVDPWGKVQLVRSTDDGETWSAAQTIVDGPLDDRDAGIMELANGDLVLTWFTSLFYRGSNVAEWNQVYDAIPNATKISELNAWTLRSTDGGATWGERAMLHGIAPHGGIPLRDGRLVMVGKKSPADYYVGMAEGDPRRGDTQEQVFVDESTDNGRSWHILAEISGGSAVNTRYLDEPHLAEMPDGRLVAQFRLEDGTSVVWQSESADGGRTWTTVHPTPLVGLPPHLLVLNDGRLLCTYCCRKSTRFGIWACVSDDGGATWNAAKEIRLCTHWEEDMGYTSSVQLGDGSILTAYYMRDVPGEGCCLMGTKWRLKQR